ncbi:cytochrome P450 [Multifurca ochricompacta]|uniref:Cytochrome P450 n=1 Tax=Multifurca ochricompacta TaxID=376703 RepID=A0AAD4QL29_9AGAM|nr:cytochrome P450 [Multifurca ochricompacta]
MHLYYWRLKRKSPLDDLPGPPAESFLLGNLRQLMREQAGSFDRKWQNAYGTVARIKAPCGDNRLWVSDPKALQYILQTSRYNMVKPYAARFLLNSATGPGVNGAEGEDHYRQRRILLPAFGPSESRAQIPVFRQCASDLVEEFRTKMESQGSTSRDTNIPHFLTYAILNALGLAAFNYNFRGHGKDREEFAASLRDFMVKGFGLPSNGKVFFQGIMDHLPTWALDLMVNLPTSGLTFLRRHVELSNGIAQKLIQSRLTEEDDGDQKDALSRIVIANRSESEKWRLSDTELFLSLRNTILGAGHETTVTSMGWILFQLANHPDEQRQLREEILAARAGENGDDSRMVNLDTLSFMNAVIKETLRFDTVVPHLFREAIRDEVVPLSKPIRSKSGKVIEELFIPKGTSIIVSNAAYNRNKDLWGEDADVWRPSRWLDGTVKNTGFNVGVWGNLMSFGAGHRACLGWRFAVTEMQCFLFELVSGLQFDLTEKATRIRRENCLVMLPMVGGEEQKGNQLPLIVSLVDHPKL